MAAEMSNMQSTELGSTTPNSLLGIPKTTKLNKYALAAAVLASSNSALLGYDMGVMSGAVLSLRENLNFSTFQIEIMVGSLNVCSLIGSLASGKTSDWIGRRYTIFLAAATFLLGVILMALAPTIWFLMVGRSVAGIGVGYTLMIAPVYVAELSPAISRGFLTSLPEVFINVGLLFGYMSNLALSGDSQNNNWRLVLGIATLPAICIGLCMILMPESPRWLVMKGRLDEARMVLISTCESEEEANLRLTEIFKAASDCMDQQWKGQGVWKELLLKPSRPIRRFLVISIGINFFMQASGNDAIVYYCPEVFKDAGIHDREMLVGVTVIMAAAKTFFVLISALFLDRFGRRPMLLLGSIGMAISLAGLGFASKFLHHSDSKPVWVIVLSIVAVCAVVSFFSIGLGPMTWVYSSEVFPMRLRAQGSSLAVSVNRLVSGAVSMSFLSISRAISYGGTFFIFSGMMVLGSVFFYFFLPETKGKTLEEIGVIFDDDDNDSKRYKLGCC